MYKHRFSMFSKHEVTSFNVNTVNVESRTRPVRVRWSATMAEDLATFASFDAEAELTALLSDQLSNEIDREILDILRDTTNVTDNTEESPFEHISFPIVRRVFSQTLGNDLVTVQPMGEPMGVLPYFNVDNLITEPSVYSDGSWSVGNTYESVFIKSTIRKHKLVKKKKLSIIDTDIYRMFTR